MLIETSISSSIKAGLVYICGHRKQDSLCDWMPGNETWQMSSKCEDDPYQSGCKEAEYSCPRLPGTGSLQSSVSELSGSPMPTIVYSRRRKKRRGGCTTASAVVANCWAEAPVNSKRSGDCLSVVSSDALSEAVLEQNGVSRFEIPVETSTIS